MWHQASERLLFSINIQIKCPKGKSVQNKQEIWCPRHAVGLVKDGQCSEGGGSKEGAESGGRTCTPLSSGAEGAVASFGGFVILARQP